MAKSPERTRVTDLLQERLRSDILAGVYPSGSLLPPERELAERYGVNRTSLRQTLARLEQVRLVETRHGIGTTVLSLEEHAGAELLSALVAGAGPEVVRHVLDARRLVGALIAREAARQAGAVHRAELRRALEHLRRAAPGQAAHDAENDFHRALAGATGNTVLKLLVNTFVQAYAPFRSMLHSAFREPRAVAGALEALVLAVEDGDAAAAEAAADAYLDSTGQRFARTLAGRS